MRKVPLKPRVSKKAIYRSVASSTAIETGQSISDLESKLKNPSMRKYPNLKLA